MDTFDKMYKDNPDHFDALPASELKEIQNNAMKYDINNFAIKAIFFAICSILFLTIGSKLIILGAPIFWAITSFVAAAISLLASNHIKNLRKAKIYSYNFFQELFEANNI